MYDVLEDVRLTLAAYLRDPTLGLQVAYGDPATKAVTILDDWPNPRATLPDRAVSVVVPDQPPDVRYWSPAVFELTEDAPASVTGRVKYSFGRFKVAMQLDVFAKYRPDRRDLLAALNPVLHRHPQVTLPGGDGYARPARWHELSRLSIGLPGALIVYRFDDVQVLPDDGGTTQSSEFRATLMGSAWGLLTTEEACGILRAINLGMTVADTSGTATETFTTPDP